MTLPVFNDSLCQVSTVNFSLFQSSGSKTTYERDAREPRTQKYKNTSKQQDSCGRSSTLSADCSDAADSESMDLDTLKRRKLQEGRPSILYCDYSEAERKVKSRQPGDPKYAFAYLCPVCSDESDPKDLNAPKT